MAPDLAKLLTDLVDLAEEIRQIQEDDMETPDRVPYGVVDRTGWTALTEDGGSLTAEKYYLTDNVTLTTNLTIPANAKVTLDLNGFTLTGNGKGSVITVLGELTLEDTSDEGTGTVTVGVAKQGGGVYSTGTFIMNSGAITGNKAENGGGVYSTGPFTMNGGTITGNEASKSGQYDRCYGGGVYSTGAFTMNDGAITGNKVSHTGSFAASSGGGVCSTGTFIMNKGTINGNTAGSEGGGVYSKGTFTMMPGSFITSNTSNYCGGGVYNENDGTFTMKGGTITRNKAREPLI